MPGLIDTVRGASAGRSLVHPSHSNPPIGRKGYPVEVATMISNLCGPNSDFITGQQFMLMVEVIFHKILNNE